MDGNAFGGLFAMFWVALITLPFAVWKWIEIIIWLYNHLEWK